jgi:hypothetical protein
LDSDDEKGAGSSFSLSQAGNPGPNKGFMKPGDLPCSPEKKVEKPAFIRPSLGFDDIEDHDIEDVETDKEKYPAAQRPGFKMPDDLFDDTDELSGVPQNDQDLLSSSAAHNRDSLANTSFRDDSPVITQGARCPMCYKPVDSADLKAFGKMNTREQGKFCISHQRKTAEQEWKTMKYPKIKWEKLDNRIANHHAFIKKLIMGQDSHYRAILNERVNEGKDRTLLKMTSNLIPGYYGARGLQAISENIMHKFTPLLKKQMVVDRLMSARGVTPYVQLVLVPEVTVLLIMQDMKVNTERARDILDQSVGVGELLNEEVREVVSKSIGDSEEDYDDDDYTVGVLNNP